MTCKVCGRVVLAGETNTPGTYSKRTVNLLSDLDKNDAELFTQFCGFGWMFGYVVPLVFDVKAEIYNRHGINFSNLSHLESIGLVQIDARGFQQSNLSKRIVVHYYNRPLFLEMREDADNNLSTGHALLTKNGQELAPICGSKPVDGFYEYVRNQWREFLPEVENTERKE